MFRVYMIKVFSFLKNSTGRASGKKALWAGSGKQRSDETLQKSLAVG